MKRTDVQLERVRRRAQALREAGAVQRFHTVPTLGDASVACHSYNMALLLVQLLPEYPPRLLEAVLVHDSTERWIGDTPAPAKYTIHPPLGRELAVAEQVVEEALGVRFDLSPYERDWLKALDLLEAMMFAADQRALGNRNYELTEANCRQLLKGAWVPVEVRDFVRGWVWERTQDVVAGESMGNLSREQMSNG